MRLRAAALTGLAALAAAAPAHAATFTVTTTTDPVGASGCTATLCTVRTAISAAAANGTAADDVIVMPAGQYAVTVGLGALTVPNDATRITFQGAGANTTSIEPPSGIRALVIGTGAGVTLTGLTLRGGTVASGQGGNLLVQSGAALTLNRARITGGTAPQGGGIGALGAASLTIQSSLIDNNFTTGSAISASGGGLYVQGQTTATAITIQDTTIASNGARNGGGIAIDNNATLTPALRGVTLTRNTARAGTPTGIGGIYAGGTGARFQGSIVAGNLTTINLGPGPTTVPANCSLAQAATDDGGNVTSDATDQCGLGGVHTDPQLAGTFDSAQPPALAIPANSSALNIAACGSRTVDQRGVTRPQGVACDAGAYEYDGTAPDTQITAGPTGNVASTSATFTYTSTETGSSFQCSLDGATFGACPAGYTGLSQGPHTFRVQATDAAGNTDPTPATRPWTVDTVAPDTTLTPISSPSNDSTPTFTFTSEAGATFQCRIDGAGYAACGSPYTTGALADGSHTFEVRARDAAGNVDASPGTQTFEVETRAPDATIDAGPPGATNDATPTLAFSAGEPSTFSCRVDGAAFEPCVSPFTTVALADGVHTFDVRATDLTGNLGPAARREFTVDTTPPAPPAVVSGPDGPTTDAAPAFGFDAPDAATTDCRLDGPAGAGEFGACASPRAFSALAPGDYVFFVRSTDAAGNSQTTQRAFSVTVAQQATPTPTPVANQTVNALPVSGIVLVKVGGRFVPLVPGLLKNGTEVDARKGVVQITTAAGEVARFYDGVFKITQAGDLTTLTLTEKLTGCPKARKSSASAAAKKPKTRKLWGDGKGRFKTKGQYSAATVRGTKWLVQDSCTTTLTRVTQGVVEVEDFAKRKKVLVKQGKRYTARPRR